MPKKTTTRTKNGPKKQKVMPPSADTETASDTAKKFDYGGLPERNLKKNLGC